MKTNGSDSLAVNPTPCSASSPLKVLPLPRPRASSKPNRQSTKPIGQSTATPPPTLPRVDVPPHALLRTRHPSLNEGLRETQSHDGFFRRRSPPVRDAWEERMLAQQRREISIQRCSIYTGYTRGPQMLKAAAELKLTEVAGLKTRSHS